MKVRFLGVHNCESPQTKLSSLLIDDVMVVDTGGVTSSLSFDDQRRLKAVLLTHQHFDHIRDTATIVFNFSIWNAEIDIYSIQPVYEILTAHLFNNKVYPDFLEWPPGNPRTRFNVLEPYETRRIAGYSVLPVPVKHSVPAVGYQITSADDKMFFYAADTGSGLADCWQYIAPQLLIMETTAPNRLEEFWGGRGHLTPNLLKQELTSFRELKGYLPQVVLVHMIPGLEEEIKAEVAAVAEELNHPISVGYEGLEISL